VHGRLGPFSRGRRCPAHEPDLHRSRPSLTRAPVPCQITIPPGHHSTETISGPGEMTPGIAAPGATTARNPHQKAPRRIFRAAAGVAPPGPEADPARPTPTTPDDRPSDTTPIRHRPPRGPAGMRLLFTPGRTYRKLRSRQSSPTPSKSSEPTADRQVDSRH
jgi:hypothetical protein